MGWPWSFFKLRRNRLQCAMEIARTLKNHPQIRLRMGVHSGPVDQVKDVNDRTNVAGAGMNIAQRVMDCGDAGHILVSKRVADDLAQDRLWQPHLHELGEIEVKHGAKLGVVNLYTEELGNPDVPQKFRQLGRQAKMPRSGPETRPGKLRWALVAAAVVIVGALAVGIVLFRLSRAPTGATTSAAFPVKSIGVLPFETLSEEKTTDLS